MKRIRIAFVILGLIVALAATSHVAVYRVTQAVQTQLSQIRAAAQEGNFPDAAQMINATQQYYTARQHLLELFIQRETVTAVSVNLHGLSAYAGPESIHDLLSEIDKVTEQLCALEHLFFSIF